MTTTMVNYHAHTNLSVSDSLLSVKDLIKAAQEMGAPAVCCSEHGHAASMPVFFREAEKAGIKPILGMEAYFIDHDRRDTEKSSYHILITVKDEIGYQNYLKLMYLSNVPVAEGGGFYGRPRITDKMLYEYKEGLIVSTSCVMGPIAQRFLQGNDMDAYIVAEEMQRNLGHGNFFIEIMPNRFPMQVEVNRKLVQLGKKLGIPVITTLDVHYKDKSYDDAYLVNGDLRRNVTQSIRNSGRIDCLTDPNLYYKGVDEIFGILESQDIPRNVVAESLENTLAINELITFKWENRHFEQPKFCEDADTSLERLLSKCLVEKFGSKHNIPQEYKERTRWEFNVIKQMGFSNYFLILHDAVSFGKSRNVVFGPGRGSGAGCLLLWILGITKIDSLKYNLPFERFLNPERTGVMPDVDVDLLPEGREVVMNYLKDKWGATNVCQVANHSELKIKAALKDVGKWLEIKFDKMNEITAAIPAKGFDEETGDPVDMDYEEAIKIPQVQKFMKEYPDLFKLAEKLTGSYRQFGIHAGAFCILPAPAETIIPVMKKKNDTGADVMVSQWDKKMLESVGIHKYDFLGLLTLAVLAECEKMTGIKCDDIPLDDKKTWKFFQEAKHMLGIFQFIQDKTKKYLRDVKPTTLHDLADVNSIIRPGADAETYLKNRKSGVKTYKFNIPEVLDTVRETYGAIVYQEQVIFLLSKLGGFTLGEGDIFRRVLEKGDRTKIEPYHKRFLENCKYPEQAQDMFEWIAANANYGFNKSHALVYSLIGYWCAYYKSNYPEVFLVANLNHPKKSDEMEHISAFITEARQMGIKISLPRLGACSPKVTLKDGVVYYGLARIKGISDKTAEVLSNIEAESFGEFVEKALAVKNTYIIRGKESQRSVVNKGHIKALCKIGFFGPTEDALRQYNVHFKEEEDLNQSDEDNTNEAVGFEWYSPLLKYYDKMNAAYRNEDKYILMLVKMVKKGVGKNGYEWTMVKGTTPIGEITGFIGGHALIDKGDAIIASYRKKGDTYSFDSFNLVE